MKANKAQTSFLMAILCADWKEVWGNKNIDRLLEWSRHHKLISRGYGSGALIVTDEGMKVIMANIKPTPTAKGG